MLGVDVPIAVRRNQRKSTANWAVVEFSVETTFERYRIRCKEQQLVKFSDGKLFPILVVCLTGSQIKRRVSRQI